MFVSMQLRMYQMQHDPLLLLPTSPVLPYPCCFKTKIDDVFLSSSHMSGKDQSNLLPYFSSFTYGGFHSYGYPLK